MPRLVALLLGLAVIGLCASGARARGTIGISIDQTPARADWVGLARVTAVKERGPGLFQGTRVVLLDVQLQVEQTLKGSPAATLTVRHLRLVPIDGPVGNGFSFVELELASTYLFFLKRDPAGRFTLVANEDSNLISLTAPELARATAIAPQVSLHERLVSLLENQLRVCTRRCHPAIWLLGRSTRYLSPRRRPGPARQAFVDGLVRVTGFTVDDGDNPVLAAYTLLGQLGETAILPSLIARICAPQPAARGYLQVNSVSWLQGFAPAVEKEALGKVIACAQDPATRERAAWKLRYLSSHP